MDHSRRRSNDFVGMMMPEMLGSTMLRKNSYRKQSDESGGKLTNASPAHVTIEKDTEFTICGLCSSFFLTAEQFREHIKACKITAGPNF